MRPNRIHIQLHPLVLLLPLALLAACTQETQNQFKRGVQNWTGTDGVLEVYASDKLVKRFLKVDKLSTAIGTGAGNEEARAYRFGYGVLDENLNGKADDREKRVYFEVGGFATYVFFENPH